MHHNLLLRLPKNPAKTRALPDDAEDIDRLLDAGEELARLRPDDCRPLEMLKNAYSLLEIEDKRDHCSRLLAQAYERKYKWSQAIKEYREILRRHPNEGDVAFTLARLVARFDPTGDAAVQPGDQGTPPMTTPPSDTPEGSRADYFATTHWSVVLRAGQAGSPQSELALNELCQRYWYPL